MGDIFNPGKGSNQTASVTDVSASKTIDASHNAIRVCNSGAKTAYFRLGTGTTTATTADTPILSGGSEVFIKGYEENTVAYIAAAGESSTLLIQTGYVSG